MTTLTARLPEHGFTVITAINFDGVCWTGIWRTHEDHTDRLVWLHDYNHDHNDPILAHLTPGGLAEAHECVVAQVRRGSLPPREETPCPSA